MDSLFFIRPLLIKPVSTPFPCSSNANGIARAAAWLDMLDGMAYRDAWEAADPLFREAVSPGQWHITLSGLRMVFGPVKERVLLHDTFTRNLPGLPEEAYLILRFISRFENKQNAVETLTLIQRGQDGWQVAGFFVT